MPDARLFSASRIRFAAIVVLVAAFILNLTAATNQWGYPVAPYVAGSYTGRSFFYDANHLGEDEAEPEKTPVSAIGPGVIKYYGASTGYGELVVAIEHDLGTEYTFFNAYGQAVTTRYILSIYGHLRTSAERDGVGTGLKLGDAVTVGTIVGYVNDDAHNDDGAEHVHLGVRLSDAATAKVRDAQFWLRGYNTDRGTDCGARCAADFTAASVAIQLLRRETAPQLQVTPAVGPQGTTFDFSGRSFSRLARVDVFENKPSSIEWLQSEQVANEAGTLSWRVATTCSDKAGTYSVVARDPLTWLKGDLNGDGIVNSVDYSLLNLRWFKSDPFADLNGDSFVNSIDWSIMNAHWLENNPGAATAFVLTKGC